MNSEVITIVSENKNSDQKNRDPSFKEFFEQVDSVLKGLSKVTIAAGILLVSFYCIHIDFYPKGLSVGDTIVFLFCDYFVWHDRCDRHSLRRCIHLLDGGFTVSRLQSARRKIYEQAWRYV